MYYQLDYRRESRQSSTCFCDIRPSAPAFDFFTEPNWSRNPRLPTAYGPQTCEGKKLRWKLRKGLLNVRGMLQMIWLLVIQSAANFAGRLGVSSNHSSLLEGIAANLHSVGDPATYRFPLLLAYRVWLQHIQSPWSEIVRALTEPLGLPEVKFVDVDQAGEGRPLFFSSSLIYHTPSEVKAAISSEETARLERTSHGLLRDQ